MLDADEYVQPEGHQQLREFLTGLDFTRPVGFLLPVMNFVGRTDKTAGKMVESSAARLFSNHKDIYYTKPIHEQLTYKHGAISLQMYPFIIFHMGYTDEIR